MILATLISFTCEKSVNPYQYLAITSTLLYKHIYKFTAKNLTIASSLLIRWIDFCFEYIKYCRARITI